MAITVCTMKQFIFGLSFSDLLMRSKERKIKHDIHRQKCINVSQLHKLIKAWKKCSISFHFLLLLFVSLLLLLRVVVRNGISKRKPGTGVHFTQILFVCAHNLTNRIYILLHLPEEICSPNGFFFFFFHFRCCFSLNEMIVVVGYFISFVLLSSNHTWQRLYCPFSWGFVTSRIAIFFRSFVRSFVLYLLILMMLPKRNQFQIFSFFSFHFFWQTFQNVSCNVLARLITGSVECFILLVLLIFFFFSLHVFTSKWFIFFAAHLLLSICLTIVISNNPILCIDISFIKNGSPSSSTLLLWQACNFFFSTCYFIAYFKYWMKKKNSRFSSSINCLLFYLHHRVYIKSIKQECNQKKKHFFLFLKRFGPNAIPPVIQYSKIQ